jgi:hypothetical protein
MASGLTLRTVGRKKECYDKKVVKKEGKKVNRSIAASVV